MHRVISANFSVPCPLHTPSKCGSTNVELFHKLLNIIDDPQSLLLDLLFARSRLLLLAQPVLHDHRSRGGGGVLCQSRNGATAFQHGSRAASLCRRCIDVEVLRVIVVGEGHLPPREDSPARAAPRSWLGERWRPLPLLLVQRAP